MTLEGDLTPDQIPDVLVPLIPLGAGFYRVITTEPYPAEFDRDAPMTLDELRASIRRVNGRDLPIGGTRWVSRFTDSSRQAATLREAAPTLTWSAGGAGAVSAFFLVSHLPIVIGGSPGFPLLGGVQRVLYSLVMLVLVATARATRLAVERAPIPAAVPATRLIARLPVT